MDEIENQTFDEIAFGATASLRRTLIWDDIRLFGVAMLSAVGIQSTHPIERRSGGDLQDSRLRADQRWGGGWPLAFDTAVSEAAAKTQRITSPVAEQADILGTPNLETGTLLAKQLEYLAEAQAAGVVLGAHACRSR